MSSVALLRELAGPDVCGRVCEGVCVVRAAAKACGAMDASYSEHSFAFLYECKFSSVRGFPSVNQFGRVLVILQGDDCQPTRVLRQHTSDLEHRPGRQQDLRLGGDGRELADVDPTAGVDLHQQTGCVSLDKRSACAAEIRCRLTWKTVRSPSEPRNISLASAEMLAVVLENAHQVSCSRKRIHTPSGQHAVVSDRTP